MLRSWHDSGVDVYRALASSGSLSCYQLTLRCSNHKHFAVVKIPIVAEFPRLIIVVNVMDKPLRMTNCGPQRPAVSAFTQNPTLHLHDMGHLFHLD